MTKARYKCINCGKEYEMPNHENQFSVRCEECSAQSRALAEEALRSLEKSKAKEKEIRLEKKRTQLKDKDAYSILAQLKMLLRRSKKKFQKSPQGWWVSSDSSDGKESILQECEDILDAYDIPPKYLIAETLDSKED